jgi:hypothetical protein
VHDVAVLCCCTKKTKQKNEAIGVHGVAAIYCCNPPPEKKRGKTSPVGVYDVYSECVFFFNIADLVALPTQYFEHKE